MQLEKNLCQSSYEMGIVAIVDDACLIPGESGCIQHVQENTGQLYSRDH